MVMKRKREDTEQEEASAMADSSNSLSRVSEINNEPTPSPPKFKCNICNREFTKFQALGGHRASHKKPANLTDSDQESEESKMHECSICGARFFIGQALGGHMRKHQEVLKEGETKLSRARHRVVHEVSETREAGSVSNKPGSENERLRLERPRRKKVNLNLDLNLTPTENGLERKQQ